MSIWRLVFFVLLMFDCVGSNGSTINLIPVYLSLKLRQKLFQDTKQHVTKWIAGTAVTGGLYCIIHNNNQQYLHLIFLITKILTTSSAIRSTNIEKIANWGSNTSRYKFFLDTKFLIFFHLEAAIFYTLNKLFWQFFVKINSRQIIRNWKKK